MQDFLDRTGTQLFKQQPRGGVAWTQHEIAGRWIAWNDVLKGVSSLKHRLDETVGGHTRAQAAQKYLILLLMPPGRAREYATMEIIDQRKEAPREVDSRMNACIITPLGQVSLQIGSYKTVKTHGVQVVRLCSHLPYSKSVRVRATIPKNTSAHQNYRTYLIGVKSSFFIAIEVVLVGRAHSAVIVSFSTLIEVAKVSRNHSFRIATTQSKFSTCVHKLCNVTVLYMLQNEFKR